MEGELLVFTEEKINFRCQEIKEEIKEENEYVLRELNGCEEIKEEVYINDNVTNKCDLDPTFQFETVEAEPSVYVVCNDENTIKSNEPFRLCLTDDDGLVLEEYVEKNGVLTPLSKNSKPKSKKRTRKPKKLLRKNKHTNLLERNKKTTKSITKRVYRQEDEVFKNDSYFCELCHKEFVGRKIFRLHLRNHTSFTKGEFHCLCCDYKAKMRGHFNLHLVRKHCLSRASNSYNQKFPCSLCDHSFYYQKDLNRHMFVHTRQGIFKCDECDFSHSKKESLRVHKMRYHGVRIPDENFYECHDCGRKYSSKDSLSKHIKTHEYQYKCDDCGYIGDCLRRLELHKESHTGVRSYTCAECDYSCSYKSSIAKHIASVHCNERHFVCAQCSKSFKRRAHLLSHLRSKRGCKVELKKKRKN